jgi:hypothetical protein
METQKEQLVRDNEGDGISVPETEDFPSIAELAAAAVNPEATEPATEACPVPETRGTSPVEPDSAQEPQPPVEPVIDESVPPELRPDKDGNPPKLTEALMRKLRGKYFTVRHPLLTDCGHKLDMINQPKNNCENCWFQFFNTHAQLVEVTDQFFRTHGKNALVGMRGIKYAKNFGRYMVTVAHFMKEEGRLSEPSNPEGTDAGSVNGDEASIKAGEGRTDSPIDQQVGQAEGGRISSGLHEQAV